MTAKKPAKKAVARPMRKTATRPLSESLPDKPPLLEPGMAKLEAQLGAIVDATSTWLLSHLRQRSLLVWLVPTFVLIALWATDPDGGASTKIWIIRVLTAVVAIALAHWGRKAMFDYPEADLQALFRTAGKESTGAGLALVAVSIVLAAMLMLFGGMAHADTLEMTRAQVYLPMLHAEAERTWPSHPQREILAGQISNETACPRAKSCWLPTAQLKSAREEGAGFPQLTRTWRADGTQRFDALQELKDRHPALRELSWENVYRRPDLQLRAFLLKAHDDFNYFAGAQIPAQRATFALVAHNRGAGGVASERRACAITAGCDPQRWAGNVERTCTASRAALYGNRSACDISRAYPRDIAARAVKYRGLV